MKGMFTIAALLLITVAHAQTTPATTTPQPVDPKTEKGFHFGLKADLNLTSIRGTGMNTKFGTGAQAGVFGEYVFNKTWSFQPELLFTQSNTKRSDEFMVKYNNAGRPNANENIKLSYISLPLLAKYNVTKMFSILAGPQVSYMTFDNEDLLLNNQDAFKKFEVSANVGAQFNISSVSLYARYNLGLSNINNVDDRYPWHSEHIQIGIAVKIK